MTQKTVNSHGFQQSLVDYIVNIINRHNYDINVYDKNWAHPFHYCNELSQFWNKGLQAEPSLAISRSKNILTQLRNKVYEPWRKCPIQNELTQFSIRRFTGRTEFERFPIRMDSLDFETEIHANCDKKTDYLDTNHGKINSRDFKTKNY